MSKILVIRFSALGDVAMTVPVISSYAIAYPKDEIIVLSKDFLHPLFVHMNSNVKFMGINLNNYKGISGLNKLYEILKKEHFDYVVDLHDVLRTKYLDLRFNLSGVPVKKIKKGRKDKNALIRKKNKKLTELPSSFERYKKVFTTFGKDFEINFTSIYKNKEDAVIKENIRLKENSIPGEHLIGIAPFAKHEGKIYPLNLMEQVIFILTQNKNYKIFLFGGGSKEEKVFNNWCKKYNNVISLAGKFDMGTELKFINSMDVMLSMDSANMHFASLVNTKIVSIWGATHPYCGFLGWGQDYNNIIQLDLPCRPCSVYGNKKCMFGDYHCLKNIKPETIYQKMVEILSESESE